MYEYESLDEWVKADPDVVRRPEDIAEQFSPGDDPQVVWAALWGLLKGKLAEEQQIAAVFRHLLGRNRELASEVFALAAAESPGEMLQVLAAGTDIVVEVIEQLLTENNAAAAVRALNVMDPRAAAGALAGFAEVKSAAWATQLIAAMDPSPVAAVLPHVFGSLGPEAWWILWAPQQALKPFLLDVGAKRVDDLALLLVRAHGADRQTVARRAADTLAGMDTGVAARLMVRLMQVDQRLYIDSSYRDVFPALCRTHRGKALDVLRAVLREHPALAAPLIDRYVRYAGIREFYQVLMEMDVAAAVGVLATAAGRPAFAALSQQVYRRIQRGNSGRDIEFLELFRADHPKLAAQLGN